MSGSPWNFGGGAGKSVLAERVSELLGGAPTVHADDFASWEKPVDWWPRLLEQVPRSLAANRPARYQALDWADEAPDGMARDRPRRVPRAPWRIGLTSRVPRTPRPDGLGPDPASGTDAPRSGARRAARTRSMACWMAEEDAYLQPERPDLNADLVVSGTD
jgi:hypothetical protein